MSVVLSSVIGGVLRRSVCRSTAEVTQLSRAATALPLLHLTNTTGYSAPTTNIILPQSFIPTIQHFHTTSIHQDTESAIQQQEQLQDEGRSSANSVAVAERDKLYSSVEVECRSSEPAVLRSYLTFVTAAAGYLDVPLQDVEWPKKHIHRWTLLKSVHIHKKHRVQYEVRTHFLIMRFVRLTSSTAETFLEYIQRNLPEGVSMKVTKNELSNLPEHIK
ncbi:unnamed protein product [Meganyctiphanes norvegica]|uniref:Small ribosomal subunit protein uS10m n=1 Tax=Meganyctiphanes norvegica TaxID=48144 RepID=A0AAV2SMV3_MEGNR